MLQNVISTMQPQYCAPQSPNAVSINIYSPTAYGSGVGCSAPQNVTPVYPNGFYSMYGQNPMPYLPYYPQNYNNMIQQQNSLLPNGLNAVSDTNLKKTSGTDEKNVEEKKSDNKKEEKKKIIPLTDEYVKSLENYMNNDNPKIRLIGVRDLLERFKEDENRKDNPSLIPLLNKALKDPSPTVRFVALTILQLGYSVGNDETVQVLKEIQNSNKDGYGEDSLLASEILLKLSAPEPVDKKVAGEK